MIMRLSAAIFETILHCLYLGCLMLAGAQLGGSIEMQIRPPRTVLGESATATCTYRITERTPLLTIGGVVYHTADLWGLQKYHINFTLEGPEKQISVTYRSVTANDNGTTHDCYVSLWNGTTFRSNTATLVVTSHEEDPTPRPPQQHSTVEPTQTATGVNTHDNDQILNLNTSKLDSHRTAIIIVSHGSDRPSEAQDNVLIIASSSSAGGVIFILILVAAMAVLCSVYCCCRRRKQSKDIPSGPSTLSLGEQESTPPMTDSPAYATFESSIQKNEATVIYSNVGMHAVLEQAELN